MKIKCPHCKKELVVQEELKEGFCNYCGQKFSLVKRDEKVAKEAEQYVREHILELFESLPVDELDEQFCKANYEHSFLAYYQHNERVFAKLYAMFANVKDGEARFWPLTEQIYEKAQEKLKAVAFFKRGKRTYNYNQCVAVYLLPALLKCGGEKYGGSMAKVMSAQWKRINKSQSLEAASFAEINESFHSMLLGVKLPERNKSSK